MNALSEQSKPGRPTIAVLVTYQRPVWLVRSLEALETQTLVPDHVIVVDNDPSESARRTLDGLESSSLEITYLPTGSNLGPAGGIAAGMRTADELAPSTKYWLLLLDDDDPPVRDDSIDQLVGIAENLSSLDPNFGGVGLVGGRISPKTGRLENLARQRSSGVVRIDWINGGYLPLYDSRLVEAVGTFQEELFWGYEELEFGLRATGLGWNLYFSGDLWAQHEQLYPKFRTRGKVRRKVTEPTWRDFYSVRNITYVLRKHGHQREATRIVLLHLAKRLFGFLYAPIVARKALSVSIAAIRGAYSGNLENLGTDPISRS